MRIAILDISYDPVSAASVTVSISVLISHTRTRGRTLAASDRSMSDQVLKRAAEKTSLIERVNSFSRFFMLIKINYKRQKTQDTRRKTQGLTFSTTS